MKVTVVGTGYVGLVTGTCLAAEGNDVVCVDIDPAKVAVLKKGQTPIYEPGLESLLQQNIAEKRIKFTTSLAEGVKDAEVIFLALPTPESEDGSADLSYVLKVAEQLGPMIKHYTVVVDKSTVPVGTSQLVTETIKKAAGRKIDFDVVSNPEFLKEGQAVNDFMRPDRIVIGTSSDKAWKVMHRLYKPFVLRDESKIIRMSEASAEITKYAANAMLAARISFMNAIANVCELAGANVREVQKGVGSDTRIGPSFLHAGPGYGGSCFPKDVQALLKTATDLGYDFSLLNAIHDTNKRQKRRLFEHVRNHYDGQLKGKKFALWGLAFKAETDDVRESPALDVIELLTAAGAEVVAFDPQAIANVKRLHGKNKQLSFAEDEYSVLNGADALLLITDWGEFQSPNFDRIKKALKRPVIFDGRSLYDLDFMQEQGFHYVSIGRPVIHG